MAATRLATTTLLLLSCAVSVACGGSGGGPEAQFGTVAIVNESDMGQAPLTVTAFFLQPVGVADPGENLLKQDVLPGAVVIVGLYAPGFYNAVAVLSGGSSIQYMDVEVRANEPTNFVIPGS